MRALRRFVEIRVVGAFDPQPPVVFAVPAVAVAVTAVVGAADAQYSPLPWIAELEHQERSPIGDLATVAKVFAGPGW